MNTIEKNRQELVSRYGLKPTTAKAPHELYQLRHGSHDLDHTELHRTRGGGLLLVCSNYGLEPDPRLSMAEVAPVYSDSCRSFAREFSGVRELREVVKETSDTLQGQVDPPLRFLRHDPPGGPLKNDPPLKCVRRLETKTRRQQS